MNDVNDAPGPVAFLSLRNLQTCDPVRFPVLFASFVLLYEGAFPHPHEREDPHQWIDRLSGRLKPPQPVMDILVALDSALPDRVVGGIALEYYRESDCGLLTYVAVDEACRRRGIGKALIADALLRLDELARDAGRQLQATFAEAQDPELLPDKGLYQSACQRVVILGKLRARRVDVHYVQPALSADGDRVRHLMLLAFGGDFGAGGLARDVVLGFLREFYRALGIADPEADPDFTRARTCVPDDGARLVPLIETAALRATDVAMCLHFVQEGLSRHCARRTRRRTNA